MSEKALWIYGFVVVSIALMVMWVKWTLIIEAKIRALIAAEQHRHYLDKLKREDR